MVGTPTTEVGITTDAVTRYLDSVRAEFDELAQEMYETGRAGGVPIVQPDVAQLLTLLTRLRQPRQVVEFGTAIGFSTLAIARGLGADATITSFEIDPGRHQQATAYLARAQDAGIITADVRLVLRDANEAMAEWDGPIDMAFLDAVKEEYGGYLGQVTPHLTPRALLVVDNALMSGTVALGHSAGTHWDADTIAAQRAFNERFIADANVPDSMILPVGDGLAIGTFGG